MAVSSLCTICKGGQDLFAKIIIIANRPPYTVAAGLAATRNGDQ
jgi:hypothetical protein